MTQEQKEQVATHFGELYSIAIGLNPNIPDDISQAMKAAYMAGADYAIDMFACNWISVEDALPPQYGTYLIATEGNVVETSLYDIDGWDNWRGGKTTHWQPLPAHPISGNQSAVFTPISGNEKGGEQ